jgi:hypothetical protein
MEMRCRLVLTGVVNWRLELRGEMAAGGFVVIGPWSDTGGCHSTGNGQVFELRGQMALILRKERAFGLRVCLGVAG